MKKTLLFIALTFLFLRCSSDDDVIQEEVLACETRELGIDELGKFSGYYYINNNGNFELDTEASTRWLWSVSNDTIQVSGVTEPYEGSVSSHIFLKKNEENCVDFLFVREVYFDDNIVIDEETNEIISGGYSWSTLCQLFFDIQEYIEDERLLFKLQNKPVWIDFSDELETDEWYYEQYLE